VVAALELYLDVEATRRVRTLWRALEDEGIPTLATLLNQKHRPHISLAVAGRLAPDTIASALEGIEVDRELRVDMNFVGQFVGRVLWLGVTPTAELLAHHRLVIDRLTAAGVEIWDVYRPGQWVPHCTVSMRVPNPLIGTAIRRCLEILPVPATVKGAAITDHANDIARPL
jgi:2'-5' RNA ligase